MDQMVGDLWAGDIDPLRRVSAMADPLSLMLAQTPHILADGATGNALLTMGRQPCEPAELWNDTRPDAVARLYRGAIEAGSDLFLTNSFGANESRLRLRGLSGRAADLNRKAALIARNEADRAGRPIVVAGSMGPIGEIMAPMGSLTHARAAEMFHEQAQALKEGGADILWVESLSGIEELRAAAEAARRVGLAWCGSLCFDTAGRTIMGVTPGQLSAAVEALPNPPVAYGANCGIGASDLLRTVAGFVASGNERPIIAKANAGLPHRAGGHIRDGGTPDLMADYACLARDMGVRVIGGCCGTMPEHLRAMRKALETRPRGPRPTLETIAAILGGFNPGSDAEDIGDLAERPWGQPYRG